MINMRDYAGVPDDLGVVHELDYFFDLSVTCHNYAHSDLSERLKMQSIWVSD
jgi:hypothetical protein